MGWSGPLLFKRLVVCALLAVGALRASGATFEPEFVAPSTNPGVRSGSAGQSLDLRTYFNAYSAVRLEVRIGATVKTADIALNYQQAPITAANFINYVSTGRYAANFFHRSEPGFVVQGGGFQWNAAGGVDAVSTFPAIQNEFGISNTRGTLAMAKLGGDPNSATSQWFVNLGDNSANLDTQNGGFTVFARVLGDGMAIFDEIAALPRVNANGGNPNGPFGALPVKNWTSGNILREHTIETNAQVVKLLSFQAESADPDLLAVSVVGSNLQLTPSATRTGTTTVTVTATDLEGASTQGTLTVHVYAKGYGWTVGTGPDSQPASLQLEAFASAQTPHAPVPLQWGSVDTGSSVTRTFTLTNNGPTPLQGLSVTSTGANSGDFEVTEGAGPQTLNPGATANFSVKFTPHSHGARSAVLRVAAAQPNDAVIDLNSTGTGIDITPPTISTLSPQTLVAGAARAATMPDLRGNPVVANDDAAVVSFTQSPAPGSKLPFGEYPLVFTAADAAGNSKTVQSTVTVNYSEATVPAVLESGARFGVAVPTDGGSVLPSGSTLFSFGTPAISDDGSLAARAVIASGRARLGAIYFEDASGSNRLAAVQGQPSGLNGTLFKSFRDPLISANGHVAFTATVAAPASGNIGVWTDAFGALAPVLRKGVDLPGLPGLKLKSVTSLAFDDSALLATVKLARAPGLVTAANETALIRVTSASATTILAQTGTDYEGSKIKQISVLQPAARSAGQGRWAAEQGAVAKLTLLTGRVVIVRIAGDGAKSLLLTSGGANAGLQGSFAKLGLPVIGGDSVALLGTRTKELGSVTAANDLALLFASDGTGFQEILRESTAAAGFMTFTDPVANDQGEVAFFGTTRAAAVGLPKTSALWLTDGSGAAEIVTRVGDPAVGRDGQTIPDAAFSNITSFALPNGAGAGPIFVAQLAGRGVNAGSKLGLWALDSGGALKMLLRAGEDLVLPSGTKRLSTFTVLNSLPGSYGARRSYNSTGSIAVQATFADRSQSILRINIP